MLFEGGTAVKLLEDVFGTGIPFFTSHSTNLLAYAGRYLQLVFQADLLSPTAVGRWEAAVDGVSFVCTHGSRPDFQVLLGKSATLVPTNEIGTTTELSLSLPPLATNTTYFWKVGALRDGVTNYSSRFSFRTGARVLPSLLYKGINGSGVTLGFTTKTNRSYTIEQRDGWDPAYTWYDLLWLGPGSGGPTNVDVPLPWNDEAYWRVRVDP
jgi:hypothetical protein